MEFTVTDSGQVTLRGMTSVPADHRGFSTGEWQAGEREATAQVAAGLRTAYADAEEMFADLDGE